MSEDVARLIATINDRPVRTSLPAEARKKLRQKLNDDLPRQDDGTIALNARAWAIKSLAA